MVKIKPRLSGFESIWWNNSGSIVAASDFSKVTILWNAVFSFNKIFVTGYDIKFKFYM